MKEAIEEIKKALAVMETRKSSYLLDMAVVHEPGSVVYDTNLIRKLEVTDATIHALRWVLSKVNPPERAQQ